MNGSAGQADSARFRELLIRWEEDDLSPDEVEELTRSLEETPVARRALVDHAVLTTGIARGLRTAGAARSVRASTDTAMFGRWVRWVSMAAAGLLVAVGVWWGSRESQVSGVRCQVAASVGCRVLGVGAKSRVAAAGERIRAGEKLITAADGYASLAMAEGSSVAMNGDTTLVVERLGKSRDMTLERGEIFVEAKSPMRFNPGRYDEAAILGTTFELSRRADGATTVRVAEGQVRFGAAGNVVGVGALQSSRVGPGEAPAAPAAIEASEVAAWRCATIYDDGFDGDGLADFWAEARPAERVSVKNGFLTMTAGPVGRGKKRASVELMSAPIALMGLPVDVALARNVADGRNIFLPLDGEAGIGVEVVDEGGHTACWAEMHTCIFRETGKPSTGYGVGFGDGRGETIRAKGSTPKTWRFVVAPDGMIGVGKEEYLLQSTGSAGRPLSHVRIRLRLSTAGTEPARMNWDRIVVRRLDKWPEWRDATPAN